MGDQRHQVLITRPEPGATATAAQIAAMGLTPVVAPLLRVRLLPARLPPPETVAAILLASGNAVGSLPAPYRDRLTLTVGGATARRARDAGFTDVVSASGDAAALAVLVRQRLQPRDGPLLLAAGRGQSLDLAARLRASSYRVIRRVVYAAEPVSALPEAAAVALRADGELTVLFFSAETARCFARLVRASGLTAMPCRREAITIGDQAAMALKGLPWSRVRVAGKPTQDDMLALLR